MKRIIAVLLALLALAAPAACGPTKGKPPAPSAAATRSDNDNVTCDPPWVQVELRFLGVNGRYEPRSGTLTLVGHDVSGKAVTTRNKRTGVIEPIAQTVLYRQQTEVVICLEIAGAPTLVGIAVAFSVSNTQTGDWMTMEAVTSEDQDHVLPMAPADSWDAPTRGGPFHAATIIAVNPVH